MATTEERLTALETGTADYESRLQQLESGQSGQSNTDDTQNTNITSLSQAKTSLEERVSAAEQALSNLQAAVTTLQETMDNESYKTLYAMKDIPFYADGAEVVLTPVGTVNIPTDYGSLLLETSASMESEGFSFQILLGAPLTNLGLRLRRSSGDVDLNNTRFATAGVYLVKFVSGAWKTVRIADNVS